VLRKQIASDEGQHGKRADSAGPQARGARLRVDTRGGDGGVCEEAGHVELTRRLEGYLG
jgi:hypothetical protein